MTYKQCETNPRELHRHEVLIVYLQYIARSVYNGVLTGPSTSC